MAERDSTRARLLEAAGREFAERGYELARVRAICDRAGVNLAAVNYHFGDKERLYREVLLEAHRRGPEPAALLAAGARPPAERLRAFVARFVEQVVALGDADTWQTRLMMREIVEPTAALEFLVRESIRPRFETLWGIMRELRPEADERRIDALCFSVIGQCLHYKVAGRVMERLIGGARRDALTASYIADHIAEFTLAALGLAPPVAAVEADAADDFDVDAGSRRRN